MIHVWVVLSVGRYAAVSFIGVNDTLFIPSRGVKAMKLTAKNSDSLFKSH